MADPSWRCFYCVAEAQPFAEGSEAAERARRERDRRAYEGLTICNGTLACLWHVRQMDER